MNENRRKTHIHIKCVADNTFIEMAWGLDEKAHGHINKIEGEGEEEWK